jgi:hypothetical protein
MAAYIGHAHIKSMWNRRHRLYAAAAISPSILYAAGHNLRRAMSNSITDYRQALLLRLLGIALFLCALIGCRLLARRIWRPTSRPIERQFALPIRERLVHSDAIEQCMAKKAATRPSLPVH